MDQSVDLLTHSIVRIKDRIGSINIAWGSLAISKSFKHVMDRALVKMNLLREGGLNQVCLTLTLWYEGQ